MKSYKVQMIDRQGTKISEILPANNENELLAKVKAEGRYILEYQEIEEIQRTKKRLKLNSLVIFTYQLSAMLSAGINIVDALQMIQSKAATDREKIIYRNLYEEVQKGNSLSVAMMDQEGAFDEMMISMIKSGESTGSLDEVLQTMSAQFDRDKKINQKMRTASIYPTVLFVVSVLVVLILVTFVLPGIMSSFPEAETPALTRILLSISNFITTKWYIIAVGLMAIVGGFILALNNASTRISLHRMLLKIPKFGPLIRTVYSARCARSFASLYAHGVPTLDMIELTGKVLGNSYLEDEFEKVYLNVSRGERISKSIDDINALDPMLSAMINVGEETGDLESILNKTADYFDQEAEAALTRLVSLIEPIMIVWMGIIIALIIISIIQPILKMYEFIE